MKEAIGNSFLTSLAIVFLFIIMGLLVSALSYSKAYKAKNKIVGVIEKYKGYTADARAEVDEDLFKMGYKTNPSNTRCPSTDGEGYENMSIVHDKGPGTYDYCVYEVNSSRGTYYHVITYVHFDIPIIGSYLTFEVKGDSVTLFRLEG